MQYALLAGLKEEDRRRVLTAATRRRFKKGEVVFHEGDPGDSFHLVAKGRVVVHVSTPEGDVATLAVLGLGTGFGEQALLDPSARRSATVVAIEPAETLSLTGAAFDELRARHPSMQQLLISHLGEQVRNLSALLTEALYLPADKRLLRRLLELDDIYEGAAVPFTQEDLASLAGTTRPTANRVLRAAAEDGLIRLTRGRVEVLDRDTLARRSR